MSWRRSPQQAASIYFCPRTGTSKLSCGYGSMAHSRMQHQVRNGCPRPRHPHTATGTGQETMVSASRRIVLVERSRHIKVPPPHQRALNLGTAASPGAHKPLIDNRVLGGHRRRHRGKHSLFSTLTRLYFTIPYFSK